MSFLKDTYSRLAELESISPEAFAPDAMVPREVCGFVLALALIHCDAKNLNLFHKVIEESKPSGAFLIRKDWGEFNALVNYVNRVHVSLIHELLKLIEKQEKVLEHDFFKEVIKKIPKREKTSWKHLVDAALKDTWEFSQDVMLIRNKMGFHYDVKELLGGFQFYYEQLDITDRAFISRGSNWQENRFYFADAVANGYFAKRTESQDVENLFAPVRELSNQLNTSLWSIVTTFIQNRGFAYAPYRVEGTT